MQKRAERFQAHSLRPIEVATHEEILVGDFVRLASGSPIGVVTERQHDDAFVTILGADAVKLVLPWVCFRQASAHYV